MSQAKKVSVEDLLESYIAASDEYQAAQAEFNAASARNTTASSRVNAIGTAISQVAPAIPTVYSLGGDGIIVQQGQYPRRVPLKQLS
jgi:glycerate-2-kinase